MQLTQRNTGVLEKLKVPRQDKERPTFDGKERFIAVFTTASHGSIARDRRINSILSHPVTIEAVVSSITYLDLFSLRSGDFLQTHAATSASNP